MKTDLWEPKRRIEQQYQNSLNNVLVKIQHIIDFTEEPGEIVILLRKVANSTEFITYAEASAMKMVTQLFTDSGRTWRQAAKENSKGRMLYELFRHELKGPVGGEVASQIRRNAEIIKTLPIDLSNSINKYIAEEGLNGRRASDIAKDIQEMFPAKSKARASIIARTEVSKTSTALTRARADNIGLDWYIWRTSEDSRVRDSHKKMAEVLIKWTNPPSPEVLAGEKSFGYYHAGEIFNCRCYPEPVISLDMVQWPAKVYWNGTITKMSRSQFERLVA
jgi:SPP1 gp7 family putative phage head morphogenesis protein